MLPVSPARPAAVDLQQHKVGIWSIKGTKTQQRWLIIHNLDEAKSTGTYHIEVIGRGNKDPAWKVEHIAGHMAIREAALAASVLKPLTKGDVYPETFENAYHAWQQSNAGKGGEICEQTVIDCLPK